MLFDHSILKKRVWGILILVILILMYLCIKLLHHQIYYSASNGFYLNLKANYVDTLQKGDAVLLAGSIPLGFVVDIYPDNYVLNVKIFLKKQAQQLLLKQSTTVFHVLSETFLGSKYINVYFQKDIERNFFSEDLLFRDGDTWILEDAVPLERMQESLNIWLESYHSEDDISLQNFGMNIRSILANIQDLKKETIEDIQYLKENYIDLMSKNVENIRDIKRVYFELSSYTENLSLPKDLKINDILNLYSNISQELDFLLLSLEAKNGNIDLFLDRKKYLKREIRLVTQYLEEFITCITKNPKALLLQQRCETATR